MKYQINHETRYKASNRVSVCHNTAWLKPRNTPVQTLERHQLSVTPKMSTEHRYDDYFGNHVTHFSFNEGYEELQVVASSLVDVVEDQSVTVRSPKWETIVERLESHVTPSDLDALQFRFDSQRSHRSDEAAEFARPSFQKGAPILEAVIDLTSRVHQEFEYDAKATSVGTPVAEVLQNRRGVCQDFAHAQIAMLRSLGLAARYVSGYVRTYPPEGEPRLIGADASHAWLSVYCGELGWIDVDPTNDKLVGHEHITVAWGRDYADVTPLKGVYTGGGLLSLDVAVSVTPTP
ncbi:MAG: transglutaminase family protein [Planctomycetaceae bacterium]|nr:transglutaminase family protein [Planctomycetaceae bacterium]